MADHDDELDATQTPGFRVGAKKTVDEYKDMDKNDESLNRWKASIGLDVAAASPPDDPRRVIILELSLVVDGRSRATMDLSDTEALERLRKTPFVIKEGVDYCMRVKFKVQHEVVTGLKYIQVVKRKGITVEKSEEMIGSYGPNAQTYEKEFGQAKAPEGILARGHYEAKSKFVDDDNSPYCQWNWSFDIKKDWA